MANTCVRCSSSYSPANCKLEHQGDMPEHLLEWLQSKLLTIPNVVMMWCDRSFHSFADGNANYIDILEDSLSSFPKMQHIL